MTSLKKHKIAILYDWIDKWGGVERVLLTLHEIFPDAHFFTSYYDPISAPWAKKLTIKTSFIQHLPDFIKKNRLLSLFFYPYAFESFDFSSYDLVISVTSSFAKAIITKPSTLHICYLLTPTRFLWLYPEIYTDNWLKKILFAPFFSYLRKLDFIAAQRPDHYIAISKTVQGRIKKYYKRESQAIYPPFDIEYWSQIKNKKLVPSGAEGLKITNGKKFFLVVSRLEKYKKVDLAIKTFNSLKETLIVVGKGTQMKMLKDIARDNIHFLQDLSDAELAALYQNAQALIVPQEEDFGYTALEAQFFGCPVIAYRKGGATETVIESKTGIFFDEQTEIALTKALANFHTVSYTLKNNMKSFSFNNVEQFNKTSFVNKFTVLINSEFENHTNF